MSWLPISGTLPQYSTANNGLAADYYIKFYESGTTTPINMATDSTGGTTLAKCALSADGYPISNPLDDSTRFIPHIDQDYRIVMYLNETDADNNTTASAAFNIDGMVLQVVPTGDAANITLRDVTIEEQDDYDRSPLFKNGSGFNFGAGPHVITVPSNWTPTNADMRFYRLDSSGIVTSLTPTSTSSTTFTLAETLLSTDAIFIGDDTFRNFSDGLSDLLKDYVVGWSLQVAEYNAESFDASSEVSGSAGIAFNTDGTKMYVTSNTGAVFAYDLSTSFDVSTSVYNSENFSILSQTSAPYGIEFNTDGTKMYITAATSDTVFAYDLSTAFDVSTSVYNSESFSFTSQDTDPRNVRFNSDGTKLFMLGATNKKAYEYDLSTAFDVSTSVYSSNFFLISEDTSPLGFAFSADGTKMLVSGAVNDKVFSYNLSTAFDISTASYGSISFDVSEQGTTPYGLTFSEDGTKMFVLDSNTATAHAYLTSFIRA